MPTREEHRIFKEFQISFDRRLKIKIRGTLWRKKKTSIFKNVDGQFYCVNLYPCIDRSIRVRIETKPMEIEPLFCDIFRLPENKNKPLSSRAWGALVCPSMIFFEEKIRSESLNMEPSLDQLLALIDKEIDSMILTCKRNSFSDIIKSNELQRRNGSYGISLIMCLICENKLLEARKLANDYECNNVRCNHQFYNHRGESFNTLALRWIDKSLH